MGTIKELSFSRNPSDAVISADGNASFSVTATGSPNIPIGYQWEVSNDNGSTWEEIRDISVQGIKITGSNTAKLSITKVNLSLNESQYRCITRELIGDMKKIITSIPARLIVGSAPVISKHPQNVTANVGIDSVKFEVTIESNRPIPTYQWQISTDNGKNWTDIPIYNGIKPIYENVKTTELTINSPSASYNGCKYRCVVKNAIGTVASNAATLTINATPQITTQPKDAIVTDGKSATFAIVAKGAALSYQWQVSTNNRGKRAWINIGINNSSYGTNSSISPILVIPKAITSMTGYRYQCIVKNAANPKSPVTSAIASLTVSNLPTSGILHQQLQISLFLKLEDIVKTGTPSFEILKAKVENRKLKINERILKDELKIAEKYFEDFNKLDKPVDESDFWNTWLNTCPLHTYTWFNLNIVNRLLELFEKHQKVSTSVIPIKGISKVTQLKLKDLGIYDIAGLLSKGKTQEKRNRLAYDLDVDVKLVNVWVKQANLWRVDGMTTDVAYLLVQIGVRNPEDLSKVDEEKAYPIMERLVLAQPDFYLIDKAKFVNLIKAAEGVELHSCADQGTFAAALRKAMQGQTTALTEAQIIELFRNSKHIAPTALTIETGDEEPTYLFKDGYIPLEYRTNGTIIREGLEFLENVPWALPLPYAISGRIFGEELRNPGYFKSGYPNLLVEISGIISSTTDKNDKEKTPSAYTDGNGKFRIILPEKLNLQEGILITVSDGSCKQKFLKSASDIINAVPQQEILNLFYQLKAIWDILHYKDTLTVQKDMLVHDKSLITSLITEIEIRKTNNHDSFPTNKDRQDWADLKERLSGIEKKLADIEEIKYENEENLVTTYSNIQSDIVNKYNALRLSTQPFTNNLEKILQHLVASGNQYEAELQKYVPKLDSKGKPVMLSDGETPELEPIRELVIIDDVFRGITTGLARVFPSVKLLGEGDTAIHLPTDTAPSRVFTYGMLQRLVEPILGPVGVTRRKLEKPVDVMFFKSQLYTSPENYPQMSSLGIGYVLNMHQAWVPDGFALGSLLYSVVLAPGEEQRLVVRENKQRYAITDEASGVDTDSQTYDLSQVDDTTAAYNFAMSQMSKANSSYNYNAHADSSADSSSSSSKSSGFKLGGLLSLSAKVTNNSSTSSSSNSSSNTNGGGSASSNQSNAHNEASNTAQSFQHKIKSAADRISQAKRISVRTATSEESESVATKIIANHNHSHAMTIQYWEVMRRFRLETCIDGIDLVLFVPLKLIKFIPDGNYTPNLTNFDITKFNRRYDVLLKYADNLMYALPPKYCTGLNLIKKYAALPNWIFEKTIAGARQLVIRFNCDLLTCDDLTASLVLKNRKGTIAGNVEYTRRKLSANHVSRSSLYAEIRDIRNGKELKVWECNPNYGQETKVPVLDKDGKEKKDGNGNPITTTKIDNIAFIENTVKREVKCTFMVPNTFTDDDLSHITLNYSCEGLEYNLYQDPNYITQKQSIMNLLTPFNSSFGFDFLFGSKNRRTSDLPESYRNPLVKMSSKEVINLGAPIISNVTIETPKFEKMEYKMKHGFEGVNLMLSSSSLTSSVVITLTNSTPVLRYAELQTMEETIHHIASETLHYSQAIWASFSDDELAMMLEQYTIDMDFGEIKNIRDPFDTTDEPSTDEPLCEDKIDIPLLNCANVKKVLGFYGNCILLPFTYPQELARKLKKTSAEVQDSLYRYHTHCFRAPSTVISLPTDGMIGEAVLSETNVSEKIDLTRFWNWQDSPIDKMTITPEYLNNRDYLDGKSTKDITALGVQGADAATPVTVPDLIKALVEKKTPEFENITGLEQLKDVLNTGTTSAAEGRKQVMDLSKDMAKLSVEILKENNKNPLNIGGMPIPEIPTPGIPGIPIPGIPIP